MQQKLQVNFYLILNVSPLAQSKEIKKTYLKLAQTYHPDKNRGNKLAEKKFKQINEAWHVLKDPKKRKIFDENLKKLKSQKEVEKFSKLQTFHQVRKMMKKKEKPIDLELPLKVSLEDLCLSHSKTINYLKPVNGKKVNSSFVIQIPLGAKQDTRLRFKQKGGAEGKKSFGDLYIRIQLKSHEIFKLTGEFGDILLERPISFVEAVQSKKLDIPSPHGFLSLNVSSPIKNNQLLKVNGCGLPKNLKGDKGDLFVKILIDYPLEDSVKIQKQMEQLSIHQQKIYVEKFKDPSFIYPQVLKFQKKIQKLNKE